MKEICF